MNVIFINHSKIPLPKSYLAKWLNYVEGQLKAKKAKNLNRLKGELVIVFLGQAEAKSLNRKFRHQNKATDVLSFETEDGLGELVLCPEVLKKQSQEHGLSFRDECSYMVLHGILHLLGYEHEVCSREAQKMFALQEDIFASIDKLL